MRRLYTFHSLTALLCLGLASQTTPVPLSAQPTPGAAGSTSPSALAPANGHADVEDVLRRFLRAFNDLDWEEFRGHFEDDATVFHPLPNAPMRDDGREVFETSFGAFFSAVRSAQKGPPYLNIDPHELRIQLLGDVAIATFHLWPEAPSVGRRTLVLRNRDGRWRIAHLHASMAEG